MANKYLRKCLTPAAATETTIYTTPDANTAMLSSLRVTNNSASTTALTVKLYPQGGATAYTLLKEYALPTKQTMDVFSGVTCVLEASDVLKVLSSQASTDFVLSYAEIDRT